MRETTFDTGKQNNLGDSHQVKQFENRISKQTHMDLKLPTADSFICQNFCEGCRQAIPEKSLACLTAYISSCPREKTIKPPLSYSNLDMSISSKS